jgi:hypothetical protein
VTEIWRDMEEETIRLYPSSIFLPTSLQVTEIHVGDIAILDWQVRFVELGETRWCIWRYIPVDSSDYQYFYPTSAFPQSMLGQFRTFIPYFLITSVSQTPQCYISARFKSVHSATFAGNATEATCRLLRIPFRLASLERNPKAPTSLPGSFFTQF